VTASDNATHFVPGELKYFKGGLLHFKISSSTRLNILVQINVVNADS